MWKAEKIELIKNLDVDKHYRERALYLGDCYSLKINDVLICNALNGNYLPSLSRWQNFVCTECGVEDCNPTGILTARCQAGKFLIIPCFDEMDGFGECEDNGIGNRQCPPHEWYEQGILVIEGEMLKKVEEVIPSLSIDVVEYISEEEARLVIDWEEAVKQQPPGFKNRTF